MILGVMASAGIPGMVGFISEFVVFRGSFLLFPTQTLLCMVGSGLTSVYFLLLVNRAFFGRLAVAPATDAVAPDVLLPRVGWQDRLPAVVLALVIVALGLQPHWLTRWSESTTCSHGADGHCRRPGAGPALGAGHSGCPPWPESTFALAPEGAAAHELLSDSPAAVTMTQAPPKPDQSVHPLQPFIERLLQGDALLPDNPTNLIEVVGILKSYGVVLDAYARNLKYVATDQFLLLFPFFKYFNGEVTTGKLLRHWWHDRINYEYAEYCMKGMLWHGGGGLDDYLDSDGFKAVCEQAIQAKFGRNPIMQGLHRLFPEFLPEQVRQSAYYSPWGSFGR
jgi:hypothetical protein